MKVKVIRVIKAICFCMAVVLMVNGITDLLKPKWLENRWQSAKTNNSFYEIEKDSAEVLFLGSSVISAAVDPFQLYEEHGISSYNLGVMSQPMLATYFWFKEAIKTQDIKVAVVEIKSAGRSSEKAEEKARKSYDYMKWGKSKLQYALEYKNVHRADKGTDREVSLMEYLFPLSMYHTRWSELNYDDYDFFLGNDDSYTKGFSTLITEFKNAGNFELEKYQKGKYDGFEVDTDEMSESNKINEAYAVRLIELAKEKGIKLLFVRTPDTKWDVEQHNTIKKLADENDVDFIDFNIKSYRKALNFDYATDAADTIHLNINGAKKFTSYLGRYLAENYDLTNYKDGNSDIKKAYESELDNYHAVMKDAKLAMSTNLDDYLKLANDEQYAVILAAGSHAKNVYFNENHKNLFKELGADEAMFANNEYGTNIISVLDGKATANKIEKQSGEYSVVSKLGGTIKGGADYSITAQEQNCSVRLNDSERAEVQPNYFNIIVYNKKINAVADSVYLYSNGDNIVMCRGDY